MAKWHINPTTGNIASCSAQKGHCPFGEYYPHFSSREEAQSFFEEANRNNQIPKIYSKTEMTKYVRERNNIVKKLTKAKKLKGDLDSSQKFFTNLASEMESFGIDSTQMLNEVQEKRAKVLEILKTQQQEFEDFKTKNEDKEIQHQQQIKGEKAKEAALAEEERRRQMASYRSSSSCGGGSSSRC